MAKKRSRAKRATVRRRTSARATANLKSIDRVQHFRTQLDRFAQCQLQHHRCDEGLRVTIKTVKVYGAYIKARGKI